MNVTKQDIQEASTLMEAFIKRLGRCKSFDDYCKMIVKPPDAIKYLDCGVSRAAYRYKNLVLKTHLEKNDLDSITTEIEIWNEIKIQSSPAVALFNPVLKSGIVKTCGTKIGYSISPYVTPFEKCDKKTLNKSFANYWNFIEDLIPDAHAGNIGVFNRLPIVIDYQDIQACNFDEIAKTNLPAKLRKLLVSNKKQIMKLLKEVA